MDIGYFTISRKLKDNFLYPKNERRKFTKYEAWIYLIEKAYYFCCEKFIDNKKVIIPRGYFDCTIEQISDELNWDRRTTEKFLKMLESEQQIKRFKISKSRKSCTLVKVNNYNAFQLPNDDICKLKCKLKCKSYCTLQCKLGCTPNKELKESKIIKGKKIDVFFDNRIQKVFLIYSEKCDNLCKLTFEKKNKQVLDKIGEFLQEIDYDFEYINELCETANNLKEIANSKIDFKSLLNNHIGIMNGKYKQENKKGLTNDVIDNFFAERKNK